MPRISLVALTACLCALVLGACATTADSTSTPADFVGGSVGALVSTYGAPANLQTEADGTTVAQFFVAEQVQLSPRVRPSAFNPVREERNYTSRRNLAGGVPPRLSVTRICSITARYGEDLVIQSVETAPLGCAQINPA